MTEKHFESSDGWILCSIALSSSLTTLVGAADHLNCTTPTLEELNGALTRLGRAGLVSWQGPTLEVANEVRAFHERIAHEPARVVCEKFIALLASYRVDPRVPPREDIRLVTREELDAAGAAYHTRVREFMKKSR
jgi:hypothetical protein